MSDRMAMHIIMATIDALEINPEEVIISRSSLHRLRNNNRHYQHDESQSQFIQRVIDLNLGKYFI